MFKKYARDSFTPNFANQSFEPEHYTHQYVSIARATMFKLLCLCFN